MGRRGNSKVALANAGASDDAVSMDEALDIELGRQDTEFVLERSASQLGRRATRSRAHSADSAPAQSRVGPLEEEESNVEDDRETKSDDEEALRPRKHDSFLRRSWRRHRGGSVESAGKAGGVLDPAFVEDIRASLLEYSRIIKKRRGVGSGLYHVPETTHDWGEKQKSHHVNWSDLFFDVIYVAVAFQSGKLLSDILLTRRWEGLWYFYTTFTLLYECWSLKLHYACRFNSSDILHKIFDILEALLVALVAGHLSVSVSEIEDPTNGQLLGLCIFKVAHQLFHMLRWIELWAFSSTARVYRQARSYTVELIIGLVPLVLAVVLEALYYPAAVVIACLFVASQVQIIHEVLRLFDLGLRKNLQDYAVPMHIEYCVHRYGEWTMLMLGEGVMQIILVQFEQRIERYSTFIPAYLLMAALRVLYYSSQPFKPQGHALNQSLKRGFIWLQLQPIESCLIISVGIALTEELKKPLEVTKPGYEQYTWFLCISTALLLILVWVASVLHQGFTKEFVDIPRRIRNLKVFTYLWKVGLSISLLALPFFSLPSYGATAICLLVCVLQIITHDVWHRLTKENELDSVYIKSLGLEPTPDAFGSGRSLVPGQFQKREDLDEDLQRDMLTNDDMHEHHVRQQKHMQHAQSAPALRRKAKGHSRPGKQDEADLPPQAEAAREADHEHLARPTPAPLAALLRHKHRAEQALRTTFRFGNFVRSDADATDASQFSRSFKHDHTKQEDSPLQRDLHSLFHKYGERQIMDAFRVVLAEHK